MLNQQDMHHLESLDRHMLTDLYPKIGRYLVYLLIFSLGSYALLQSMYIPIIGGKAIFFLVVLTLLMQVWASIKQHRVYQVIALLLGIIVLIYASLTHTLNHALILLCSTSLLVLLILDKIKPKPVILAVLFILALFYILLIQHHYLMELKQHYQQFETGESWQQMGAL